MVSGGQYSCSLTILPQAEYQVLPHWYILQQDCRYNMFISASTSYCYCMACVIGASFCGGGIGIAFSSNGSTGGTDIIAAIINKYRDITLGRVMLFCDLIIISSSYFVLKDWEKVVYGYVTLYICSFVLDQVVNSARQSVQFFIISEKYEEIARHINVYPHRGATVINASGFYTGKEIKMLFVLAKKRESTIIFRLIKDIDPNAFVSQSQVIGVYGEGFDKIKVK